MNIITCHEIEWLSKTIWWYKAMVDKRAYSGYVVSVNGSL